MPIKQRTLLNRTISLVRDSPFMRHNFVFFIGSLAVSVLNYLYYPILGRLLPPADFGEVQTLLSLFAQLAVLLSILTYVTIHITVNTPDQATRNRILLGLEHAVLVGGGLMLGLSLFLTGTLKNFLNFTSVWPFVMLILAFGITLPLIIRMAFLRGVKQFAKASITDGIGSASKLLLSSLFVIIGLRSFGAVLGLAISQVISLFFGLRWARKAGFSGLGIKRADFQFTSLRPQFKYASAVFLISASITAMLSMDMLAAKHYFSADDAGLYAGITTTARIIFFLTVPFTGVLLTLINTKQSGQKNALQLKGTLGLILGFGGVAMLLMSLFPNHVIQLFVGSKYLEFASYLPTLAMAMLLLSFANTILMYQIALRRYSFCVTPVAATMLLLILLYWRNASVAEIVSNMFLTSSVLVILTVSQSIFHKILSRKEVNS